jgi:hypothetical protein
MHFKVNGVLLDRLVLEEEYVAVLFLGECLEEEKVLVDYLLCLANIHFVCRRLAMSWWRAWRRLMKS